VIGGLFFRGLVFQVFNLFKGLGFMRGGKELGHGQKSRFLSVSVFFSSFIDPSIAGIISYQRRRFDKGWVLEYHKRKNPTKFLA
jgi:hypothetical protein